MKKNTRRYFQNDQSSSDSGLNVITAGCCSYEPGEQYPHPVHPKDHLFNWNNGRILNGYYLVFITKGKGVFETQDTGTVKVGEGNMLVLFPGLWHRYRPIKETGWEEYWVGFNGPYADSLMKHKLFNPSSPVICTGLNQQLIQCYQLMINSHFMENQDFYSFLCGITLQMIGLVQMTNSHFGKENQPLEKNLEKALFLMHDRVEQSINFETLAKEVGLSYPWFRKMFKANKGIAPNQYFLNLKIKRAAELLRSTRLSVSEISYFFDFNSPFYFSRIFKKKTGLNPSDYREKTSTSHPAENIIY